MHNAAIVLGVLLYFAGWVATAHVVEDEFDSLFAFIVVPILWPLVLFAALVAVIVLALSAAASSVRTTAEGTEP